MQTQLFAVSEASQQQHINPWQYMDKSKTDKGKNTATLTQLSTHGKA